MKKYIGLLAAALLMMALAACGTQPATNPDRTEQESQTSADEDKNTESKNEKDEATKAPDTTAAADQSEDTAEDEDEAETTKAPSVSEEAAADDQSDDVKGETDNDSSIQKDIEGVEELIAEGYYDDAQATLNALKTRDLSATQKVAVEKLQLLLNEKR